MMFPELPLLERLAAARKAGFDAVEIQFPYEFPLEDVASAQAKAGIEIVLINIPIGNAPKGERGLAVLPDRVDEFRAAIAQCRHLCGEARRQARQSPAGHRAARRRPRRGRARRCSTICATPPRSSARSAALPCIEGLNTRDIPGFFISQPGRDRGADRGSGDAQLALLYDLYHAQIMEGDLIPGLTRYKAASATSSSPTRPAATSPAPASSTTRTSCRRSTNPAMSAGRGRSTSPRRPHRGQPRLVRALAAEVAT